MAQALGGSAGAVRLDQLNITAVRDAAIQTQTSSQSVTSVGSNAASPRRKNRLKSAKKPSRRCGTVATFTGSSCCEFNGSVVNGRS